MALYICFNDSDRNPTFAHLSDAFLVDSDSDADNPCSSDVDPATVPLTMATTNQIVQFANLMGWEYTVQSNGEVVITCKPIM